MTVHRTVTIASEVGLHARPAALFVRAAARFKSEIRVRYRDKVADAKSILEVLSLDAAKNAVLDLEADGEDAEAALDALAAVLAETAENVSG